MELDVYTLMYVGFAALGLALAYMVAGQRIKQLMHIGGKAAQHGQAAAS